MKLMNLPRRLQSLEDKGQTVTLPTSYPGYLRALLASLYLFSGPDAAVEVVPQLAEGVVPPPGLAVVLQPSAQLLH